MGLSQNLLKLFTIALASKKAADEFSSELDTLGGGGGASSADQLSYDNSNSGLSATDVQAAIDEVAANSGGGPTMNTGTINATFNQGAGAKSLVYRNPANSDVIFMKIPTIITTATTAAEMFSNAAIPTQLRPTEDMMFIIELSVDGGTTSKTGVLAIQANGVVYIYADENFGIFNPADQIIIFPTTVTWFGGV